MSRQLDPRLIEAIGQDYDVPVAQPKRNFRVKLEEVLSRLQGGAENFLTGDRYGADEEPSSLDMMSAGIRENERPQGFIENLSEFARKRGTARLGQLGAAKTEQGRQVDLAQKRATTGSTQALGRLRGSQSTLAEARARASDIKSQIDEAQSPERIKLLQAQAANWKASAEENMAESRQRLALAQKAGVEEENIYWEQRFKQDQEEFKQYEALEKLAIDKQDQLLRGRTFNEVTLPGSQAGVNKTNVEANRTQGLATGESVEGAAENRLTNAQADKATADATTSAQGDGPSPYSVERAERTLQGVRELKSQVKTSGRWSVGGLSSFLAVLPESDARNFRAQVETLKANIGFNELTAMREASKTGGALGNISDREISLLTAALGALDTAQSPEQFDAQLSKIEESVTRWRQAVESQTRGSARPGAPAVGTIENGYRFLGGDPANPSSWERQ